MHLLHNIFFAFVVILLSLAPIPSYFIYLWPCFVVLFFFVINVYQVRTAVNFWAWLIGLSLDLLRLKVQFFWDGFQNMWIQDVRWG